MDTPMNRATIFAHKVIKYYENEGNFNKRKTVKHFLNERKMTVTYSVIKNYETNGNKLVFRKKKKMGRKVIWSTDEIYKKFEELYKIDPEITVLEAAHILKVPEGSMRLIRKKVLQRLANSNSQSRLEEGDVHSVEISQSQSETLQDDFKNQNQPKDSSSIQDHIVDKPVQFKMEVDNETFFDGEEQFFDDGPVSPYFGSEEAMGMSSSSQTLCKSEIEEEFSLGPRPIKNEDEDDYNEGEEMTEEQSRGRGRLRPRQSLRKRVPFSVPFKSKRSVPVTVEFEDTNRPQSCLICFQEVINPGDSLEREANLKCEEGLILKNSSRIIFILKMLDTPSEELVHLMKKSKGKHPCEWITVCSNCLKWIEEAEEIHRQIILLERKLARWRSMVVCTIRRNGQKSLENAKTYLMGNVVQRRVRDLVYRRPKRPRITMVPKIAPTESKNIKKGPRSKRKIKKKIVNLEEDGFSDGGECSFSFQDCQSPMDSNQIQDESGSTDAVAMESSGVSSGDLNNEHQNQLQGSKIADTSTATISAPPNITEIKLPAKMALCDICSDEVRPMAMAMHQLKEHGVVMEGHTAIKCTWEGCKYVTLYERCLKSHQRKHQDRPRPFSCQFCEKRFLSKNQLMLHEQIHNNAETRPHQCELCGKSYAVSTYLYIHMRTTHKRSGKYWKGKRVSNVSATTADPPPPVGNDNAIHISGYSLQS